MKSWRMPKKVFPDFRCTTAGITPLPVSSITLGGKALHYLQDCRNREEEGRKEMISLMHRCFWALALAVMCLGLQPSLTVAGEGDATPAAVIEHLVQKGDNLHLIAGYYYRDPRMWRKIFSLNRETVTDPNLLHPGDILKIKADPERQWDIPYADFVARVYR
jgi:nucleoid-associated protein YgaU